MARKIKKTRPELKRWRDALRRFEHYLPTLKLKQQQLQLRLRDLTAQMREAETTLEDASRAFAPHREVLADTAGVDVDTLSRPEHVRTATVNVAGVDLPEFKEAVFPEAAYSLFGTPVWVDGALAELRQISRYRAELGVLQQQYELLSRELTKIIQRVNLFEKVKIPEAREAIRVIRIHLGDEMTAAVGRAKIAKGKLAETTRSGAYQPGWDEQPEGPQRP